MKTLSIGLLGLMAAATFIPALASASVGISLQGGDVTVVRGQSYTEPGYSAFSTTDGDVTSQVSVSPVDTSSAGSFSINYSVTDSALNSASASRSLTVRSTGGNMPFCSGPMAPGWNVSIPDGGCGSHTIALAAGNTVMVGGKLYDCPLFLGVTSCTITP